MVKALAGAASRRTSVSTELLVVGGDESNVAFLSVLRKN